MPNTLAYKHPWSHLPTTTQNTYGQREAQTKDYNNNNIILFYLFIILYFGIRRCVLSF